MPGIDRLRSQLDLRDLVAGLSVALVLVPQSLAYAQLAGMPAYRGLFAAAIPPLVAAPFGSSPYLQPGPTAVSALLTYGALSPLAPLGSTRYIALGLLLALMVGVIRVAVGLLRAGVLAYLLSQSLLIGFAPAAAILIVASQVPVLLGASPHGQHELYRAFWVLAHPTGWKLSAVVVAGAAAGVLALGRRLHPLFPGVLIAVVGAVLIGKFGNYGGAALGRVTTGFPPLTRSLPLEELPHLALPAFVIAFLGFTEAASIARTYATLDRKRWDADREFISQGVANLAAGTFGGFPVGASFSRSALNRLAGAKTRASTMVTGLAALAFLPLGFVLAPLPRSVLAAIVIVAVIPLIRLDRIVELARWSRWQLTVTLTAFVLTLVFSPHIERGVAAAIAVSIVIHLWRELRLDVRTSSTGDGIELAPQGVLWFATARLMEDRLGDLLAEHPHATRLELRLDNLGRIDLAGALVLKSLLDDARAAGLAITVLAVPAHSRRILSRVLPELVDAPTNIDPQADEVERR